MVLGSYVLKGCCILIFVIICNCEAQNEINEDEQFVLLNQKEPGREQSAKYQIEVNKPTIQSIEEPNESTYVKQNENTIKSKRKSKLKTVESPSIENNAMLVNRNPEDEMNGPTPDVERSRYYGFPTVKNRNKKKYVHFKHLSVKSRDIQGQLPGSSIESDESINVGKHESQKLIHLPGKIQYITQGNSRPSSTRRRPTKKRRFPKKTVTSRSSYSTRNYQTKKNPKLIHVPGKVEKIKDMFRPTPSPKFSYPTKVEYPSGNPNKYTPRVYFPTGKAKIYTNHEIVHPVSTEEPPGFSYPTGKAIIYTNHETLLPIGTKKPPRLLYPTRRPKKYTTVRHKGNFKNVKKNRGNKFKYLSSLNNSINKKVTLKLEAENDGQFGDEVAALVPPVDDEGEMQLSDKPAGINKSSTRCSTAQPLPKLDSSYVPNETLEKGAHALLEDSDYVANRNYLPPDRGSSPRLYIDDA